VGAAAGGGAAAAAGLGPVPERLPVLDPLRPLLAPLAPVPGSFRRAVGARERLLLSGGGWVEGRRRAGWRGKGRGC